MTRSRRTLVFVAAASVLLGTGVIAKPAEAGFGKAGVVVVHGDGSVKTECVRLTKAQISGFKLLKLSSFEFRAARFGFGRSICWIDGEGVDTTDPGSCFPTDGPTWAYFTQNRGDAGPVTSEVGPDDRTVRRGAVDYWKFGDFPQPTPSKLTLRDICR
jgi:hypothetical protein